MPDPQSPDAKLADLIAAVNHLTDAQRQELYLSLLAIRGSAGPVIRGLTIHPLRGPESEPVAPTPWATAAKLKRLDAAVRRSSAVRVLLIPLQGSLFDSKEIATLLQRQLLNESRMIGLTKDPFTFTVAVEKERSNKKSYRAMDFPVYQAGLGVKARTLTSISEDHGVPPNFHGTDLPTYVAKNWDGQDGDYGIAMPADPDAGSLVKVGFIDELRIRRDGPADISQCVANIVLHELFHWTGAAHHSKSGIMRPSPLGYWENAVGFSNKDRNEFFGRLAKLRSKAIARIR